MSRKVAVRLVRDFPLSEKTWIDYKRNEGEIWGLFVNPYLDGRVDRLEHLKHFKVNVKDVAELLGCNEDQAERTLQWMEFTGLITSDDGFNWYRKSNQSLSESLSESSSPSSSSLSESSSSPSSNS